MQISKIEIETKSRIRKFAADRPIAYTVGALIIGFAAGALVI